MKKRKKILRQRIKQIFICIGLALFILVVAIPSGLSHARDRVKPEMVLPKHYPNGFHGFGRINSIGRDETVIDDFYFKFSPSVQYHIPTSKNVSPAFFKKGDLVGYLTNSEKEITSLWLLE